ncbi:MAG: hypothetical protein U9R47_10280 [Actinomycetota bacterium]|nr:hypothetical protein [Actinomycetota bacterium]
MTTRRHIAILAVVLAASACTGSGDHESDTPTAPLSDAPADTIESSSQLDGASEWPRSTPGGAPEFPGEIDLVMEGNASTRIFYVDMKPKDIETYVSQLEDEGWEIAYVVYKSVVDPSRSEERAARGEYDLVTATRGEYRIRIEPPTLDIELVGGVAGPIETTTTAPIVWPEGVPKIPGVVIDVFQGSPDTMVVIIGSFTTGSVDEYATVLRDAGFDDIADTGFDDAALTNGELTIRLLFISPDAFNFRIQPNR